MSRGCGPDRGASSAQRPAALEEGLPVRETGPPDAGSHSGGGRQPCALGRQPGCGAGLPPSKAGACGPTLRRCFKPPWPLVAGSLGSKPSLGSSLCGTPNGVGGRWSHCGEPCTCLQPSGPRVSSWGMRSGPCWGWGGVRRAPLPPDCFRRLLCTPGLRGSEECLSPRRTKQRFLSREERQCLFSPSVASLMTLEHKKEYPTGQKQGVRELLSNPLGHFFFFF